MGISTLYYTAGSVVYVLLKLNRDVDVNFIRATALNHRQFTALFEDREPEEKDLKAEILKFCDTDIENVLRWRIEARPCICY